MQRTAPKIIGIAGTNGSGKDTVGMLLAKRHNYLFVSVTDILRDELKKQGLPPSRENMRVLSSSWRRESGLGVLVDKAMLTFQSEPGRSGLAVASLRNPGEADSVHAVGGIVLWLDADPLVRFGRVQAARRDKIRSIDDNKSFEEFMADEAVEMDIPTGGDETMLSVREVKLKSDLTLINDGDDMEELAAKLDEALGFS